MFSWCRYVHSKNRAGLSFSLALNSLSDRTLSELATMRGRMQSKTPNNGLPFPSKLYEGVKVPESLDWRLYGMSETLYWLKMDLSIRASVHHPELFLFI